MANTNKLALFIVILVLAGILSGMVIHSYASPGVMTAWASNIALPTDVFLRLIKMVIVLSVFSTLTVGIIHLGKTSIIGCVGGKAMLWFVSPSILSILVDLFVVSLEQPGNRPNLAIPLEATDAGLAVGGMGLKSFPTHTIPVSIAETMANNEILQIMMFSMFFGIGGVSLDERSNAPLVVALDVVSHIMLRVTSYMMYIAPLAIFATTSSVISTQGLGILLNYALFIGGYYVAILLTRLVLLTVDYMVLEREIFHLVSMLKDPVLVAFTTNSSKAVYPKALEQLTRLSCSPNIVSFVLPIDYSFNLVGSMVYYSFVSMFTAQAYNIRLSFAEITVLMLALILASKGIIGVPCSALVVLAATIPSSSVPAAGVLLLVEINHSLDMGRSAINVLGNGTATTMLVWDEGSPEEERELVEREA